MSDEPVPTIAATTCNLNLGGSTTFLVNLQHALRTLHIVSFAERNEHAADFAALQTDVRIAALAGKIYEDRLSWGYDQLRSIQPQAVLACLGSESYEMLRLAPPGVARIGLIQSDDPPPYELARRYHPWLDAMVGVSEEIAGRLRAMPEFREKLVAAIPYGIAFGPERKRPPSDGPLRVVYIGRIIELQKRVSRLVALIKRLPGPEFHFTIAGSGPADAEFRAALTGAPNVTLLGTIPNTEIPRLLAEQDVLVLLSDFEGLPLSLLEAMGHGVVPVVSDLPSGMREAVSPDCGLRVPVGDLDAATEALRQLAGDRAQLAKLSAAASARARQFFSAETMAGRYEALIRRITEAAQPAPWPARVTISTPLGVSPGWLYRGFGRRSRRLLKRLASP